MKKKFIFLSLLLVMYFINTSQLYAQRMSAADIFNNTTDGVNSTTNSIKDSIILHSLFDITYVCGRVVSIVWNESSDSPIDYHTIDYLTACRDGDGNITNSSDWISVQAPNNGVNLILDWGIPIPPDMPTFSPEYCETLIPSDCEQPIVIFVLSGTLYGSNGGTKPTSIYPLSFDFNCRDCLDNATTGIVASIVDLQETNLSCPPEFHDCEVGSKKTSSTVAYSPKDITLSTKPNPFNSQTTIEYTLTEEANVSLQIFDLQGRVIAQLLNQKQQTAGKQEQTWNAQQLPSGVYYYQLNVDGYTQTKKLVKF